MTTACTLGPTIATSACGMANARESMRCSAAEMVFDSYIAEGHDPFEISLADVKRRLVDIARQRSAQ